MGSPGSNFASAGRMSPIRSLIQRLDDIMVFRALPRVIIRIARQK
jgi:hypothetical protein